MSGCAEKYGEGFVDVLRRILEKFVREEGPLDLERNKQAIVELMRESGSQIAYGRQEDAQEALYYMLRLVSLDFQTCNAICGTDYRLSRSFEVISRQCRLCSNCNTVVESNEVKQEMLTAYVNSNHRDLEAAINAGRSFQCVCGVEGQETTRYVCNSAFVLVHIVSAEQGNLCRINPVLVISGRRFLLQHVVYYLSRDRRCGHYTSLDYRRKMYVNDCSVTPRASLRSKDAYVVLYAQEVVSVSGEIECENVSSSVDVVPGNERAVSEPVQCRHEEHGKSSGVGEHEEQINVEHESEDDDCPLIQMRQPKVIESSEFDLAAQLFKKVVSKRKRPAKVVPAQVSAVKKSNVDKLGGIFGKFSVLAPSCCDSTVDVVVEKCSDYISEGTENVGEVNETKDERRKRLARERKRRSRQNRKCSVAELNSPNVTSGEKEQCLSQSSSERQRRFYSKVKDTDEFKASLCEKNRKYYQSHVENKRKYQREYLQDPEINAKNLAGAKRRLKDPDVKLRNLENVQRLRSDPVVQTRNLANVKKRLEDPVVKSRNGKRQEMEDAAVKSRNLANVKKRL